MPRTTYDDSDAENTFQRSNTDARSMLEDRSHASSVLDGAGAARAQQDKEDRIANNYPSLNNRASASVMKTYQQYSKSP